MKVPFPAKRAAAEASRPYEPKSVLELRGSPSPVGEQKIISELEDHVLISPQLDEWDSLMRDLGLHDDPNPDFGLLSDIPPQNPIADLVGSDYVDDLIRLAECFETNSLQLAHLILARLNQRLRSASGKPLQRAAFYLKEALQSLLTGSTPPMHQPQEIIHTIKAHKTFSSISPIPMFSSFTANQALLDALHGSMLLHVIDFDIALGGHWASFLRDLSDNPDARNPALRISALVPEDYAAESTLIRDNLTHFARELNISFEIDFVLIRTFEYLSFKSIKFVQGEKLAVLLSPAIFRHVGTAFLNDLRRLSPHVVVHVDAEGQMGFGTTSYRQAVIDGLEFYSTLLESLEAANFNGAGAGDWMRKIETFVLYPKILEGVEAAGRRGTAWREALVAAGMRQVGLSQFAEFQAECLLRRVQVRGFHVVKRQAEMMLCWHDRPLVATSAWRF
ncbi:scarecrow-like protein 15 [Salvia miltiorrhiza]|uniref:scarecrow-like protein 15 n=1 Tax=Salvia miltiorrhiza TaxID=226208 RepID=UPI0025AD4CB8|nr:scarecrow-like protein 15 [Salvia miltiorrhiza]